MAIHGKGTKRAAGVILSLAGVVLLSGCSSHEPKPMAQPTPDQVRGHADRGFDKLKQEEQEHGAQPPASPR